VTKLGANSSIVGFKHGLEIQSRSRNPNKIDINIYHHTINFYVVVNVEVEL